MAELADTPPNAEFVQTVSAQIPRSHDMDIL